jgi:aryl-alcohol dehydrogenase-like predicted oxidoreductase
VSRLGLGCTTFGREIDEATSFQIMDYAVAKSITLFDTAEAYGGGQARAYRRQSFGIDDVREVSGEMHSSEKIIGRWLKSRGCRDRIVLQTKVSTNFTKAHVAAAVDASLERLQTDVIDLYLFHSYDANTHLEEALEAMTRVIQAGKVRVAGCSNFSAEQIRSALEISRQKSLARMEVTQPNYNLVCREIEQDLLPLCREHDVAVVTYSPLGAGFLTGKYTPDRKAIPKGTRFDVIEDHADIYFSERNFRVVERLRQHAQANGVPMVRLALAWVLRNPNVTSVLVGARTTAHLDNALEALAMEFPEPWAEEMNRWD